MITRFAPSPTGPLHLGHAYSAMLAFDLAQSMGGTFLLRIEDIDQARARAAWEAQIYDDLAWLGLSWPTPVLRQSDRAPTYDAALDRLWQLGLLYPCTCSRRDIAEAANAPQEGAPTHGPDGLIYPGTCRIDHPKGPRPPGATLRLNVAKIAQDQFLFHETGCGPDSDADMISYEKQYVTGCIGDVVLSRHGMSAGYHLAVVLDDAAQGVTHVVRGQDLFEATKIHVLLQGLMGLPTPVYHHHRLIRDEMGKRLAKRDDARALSKYRAEGCTPDDIRKMVGL